MLSRIAILAALCGTALAQGIPPRSKVPQRPDVILVTIDTLRADHVGCYGYRQAQTPVLDRLCAQGIRADSAFTASPITNTSHATIMTGLYPSHHGVADFGVPLAAKHATLAEQLKKNGYRTAAFIGAVILDSNSLAIGLNRGFDHYENFRRVNQSKQRWERVERRADAVVAKANAWLAANAQGPRFVWVHLYDPHDPYEAPEPFRSRFTGSLYDAEVAYADAALGKLFAMLSRQNRYDNALVVVMSDHGEGLGEHGENTHGIFLYDSTLHIPLIVKLPGGSRKGSALGQLLSTVDVTPTILDLLGITAFPSDGHSFKSSLLGEGAADHDVLAETDYPIRFGWAPLKAVRDKTSKFIEAPRPEFYDLRADPGELRNVYQPWNENVQALRAELAAFRRELPQPSAASTAPVDPNTIAELKALGYLGTDPGSTTVGEPSMLPDPKDKIEIQNLIHSGMMHEDSGNVTAARWAFTRAVEADPGSVVALAQLGQIEYRAGEYKNAAKHLSSAYALRPQDAAVVLTLGLTLEKTGDHRAAKDILEAALRQDPGQFDARLALGRVYVALGDDNAAADQYEAAVLLDGKKAAARIELARLLLKQGRKAEAVEQLRQAQLSEPANPQINDLLRQAK
jgi:arylsulfatase A-like enzyme/Tfp pilus assembly protein PilF